MARLESLRIFGEEVKVKKPSDFYFFVVQDEDDVDYILITSRKHFDKHGSLADDEGEDLEEILPDGFYELCDSQYEYNGDEEDDPREILIEAGFIENSELADI